MKRILILLLVLLMIVASVACSSDNNNNASNDSDIEVSGDSDDVDDSSTSDPSEPSITVDTGKETTVESTSDTSDDMSSSDGEPEHTLSEKDSDDSMDVLVRQVNQYESGKLTAGEWNDNVNYDYFQDILNDNQWYHMQSYWNFVNWDRYEFEVKNKSGEPLSRVKIELHDGQGNVHYTGMTNNKGYVAMYPFLNMIFIQAPHVEARISYNQSTYEVIDLDTQNSYFRVTLDEDVVPVKSVDIMLMVDATGSMGDELEYIKAELKDVVATVKRDHSNDLEVRASGNYYRDHGDEYLVRSFPFTTDINEVINQMSNQSANGGGDYEEAVVEALNDAIYNHQWDANAEAKLLFLVLDAPPHHTDQNIDQIHKVIKDASAAGIRIIPIASSGVDKQTEFLMRFMDVATNGTYLFLTDHSGIGNSHLTPTIGQYQVEQLNTLMVKVINSYID